MSKYRSNTSRWCQPVYLSRESQEPARFVGIRNTANNCFINSTIQCLFNNKKLTEYIIQGKVLMERTRVPDYNQYTVFVNIYTDMMNKMATGSSVIGPDKLLRYLEKHLPSYTRFNQEDAYEFLLYILNCLDNGLSYRAKFVIKGGTDTDSPLGVEGERSSPPEALYREAYSTLVDFYNKKYSVILESFYGLTLTVVDKRRVFEPFNSITLDTVAPTLDECIDEYYKPKTVDKLDVMTKVWSLPNSLIVVLKRLDEKNVVTFPEELDLTRVIHPDKCDENHYIYYLNSVVYHVGNSESGHYFTACKKAGAWYVLNDEAIHKIQNVECENAYILFYERLSLP